MDLKQIEAQLKEAADGLLMISETDEPFEYYHIENYTASELDKETVLKLAGMPSHYPVEVVELEYFLRNMTQARPESGEEGRQQAKRFEQLQNRLKELLQDVKVYRVGETNITVFILGKSPGGEIAGLRTKVVET